MNFQDYYFFFCLPGVLNRERVRRKIRNDKTKVLCTSEMETEQSQNVPPSFLKQPHIQLKTFGARHVLM